MIVDIEIFARLECVHFSARAKHSQFVNFICLHSHFLREKFQKRGTLHSTKRLQNDKKNLGGAPPNPR